MSIIAVGIVSFAALVAGILEITRLFSQRGLYPQVAFLISLVCVGLLVNIVWDTFLHDSTGDLAPLHGTILLVQAAAVVMAAGIGGSTFYYEIYHHDSLATTGITLIVLLVSLCVYGAAAIAGSLLGEKIHAGLGLLMKPKGTVTR